MYVEPALVSDTVSETFLLAVSGLVTMSELLSWPANLPDTVSLSDRVRNKYRLQTKGISDTVSETFDGSNL